MPRSEWLAIATWSCQEEASSFLGDLDSVKTYSDLLEMLNSRFGRTEDQCLDEFEALHQKVGQSIRKYGDVIRRKAYGTGLDESKGMRKFLRSLTDKEVYP